MKKLFTKLLGCVGILGVNFCYSQENQAKEQAGPLNMLKLVYYDFDGLDADSTQMPDGAYGYGDLKYKISINPLAKSDMIGDRTLRADLTWNIGWGVFGKAPSRFHELNANDDQLNFYFYNPVANSSEASVDVIMFEDDNQNNSEDTGDDKWLKNVKIPKSTGWQLISIPLKDFADANAGGNGIFDASYTNQGGKLFKVEFNFKKPVGSDAQETYYIDMICFSEGTLPYGNSILDLPSVDESGYCFLGAYKADNAPYNVPGQVEGLFPSSPDKKIHYVNWFMPFSKSGTTPNNYPGQEVQTLLTNGYTPILTWEPLFKGYGRLDPIQPKYQNIINGEYDAYINAFAEKIKTYSDTIIIRFMHEFEGSWYPWSLRENNMDAGKFISAWRKVVNMFRAKGANNVQWMWCLNSAPGTPYQITDWIVPAYPGDDYVDMLATDIYNHPDLGTPFWKSFRHTTAEVYYYMLKYFPNKPIYICEVACRERYAGEPANSQTKAEWITQMSKEIQTIFSKTRALIYFDVNKEHDWRANSSQASLDAYTSEIWNKDYYFKIPPPKPDTSDTNITIISGALPVLTNKSISIYPNPFKDELNINLPAESERSTLKIFDLLGKEMAIKSIKGGNTYTIGKELASGIYILELNYHNRKEFLKIIKN